MDFLSDNAAGVCAPVLAAIAAADAERSGAYDGDALSRRLDGVFGELFGHACTVLPVASGTAANALALAAMTKPWGAAVCHAEAHVQVDECGAPEFFSGGAKLLLVPGNHGRITPGGLAAAMAGHRGDVHQVQPSALTLTQATERGTVYAPGAMGSLGDAAAARGWRLHVDGARFANAVAHLGCHPGEISWRAGAAALSFGTIKNGGLSADAVVAFDADLVDELRFRRKRAGQMPSKGRFQAAQLLAMVESGAWLDNARAANAGAARLAAAAGARLTSPVEANELFVDLGPGGPARLRDAGFGFYDWGAAGSNEARFVVAWDTPAAAIDALAAALGGL